SWTLKSKYGCGPGAEMAFKQTVKAKRAPVTIRCTKFLKAQSRISRTQLLPSPAFNPEIVRDVSTSLDMTSNGGATVVSSHYSPDATERVPPKNSNYAGAPPSAPGRGGASGPTTTWRGGFSGGIFSPDVGVTLGGGFINSPCWISSLIWEPSSVSYSSNALAIASRWSRLAMRVCLAVWYASSSKRRTSRSISSAVASL